MSTPKDKMPEQLNTNSSNSNATNNNLTGTAFYEDLLVKNSNYEEMTSAYAEKILKENVDKEYILRKNRNGQYVMSYKFDLGKITIVHCLIELSSQGFTLSRDDLDRKFRTVKTIEEMIELNKEVIPVPKLNFAFSNTISSKNAGITRANSVKGVEQNPHAAAAAAATVNTNKGKSSEATNGGASGVSSDSNKIPVKSDSKTATEEYNMYGHFMYSKKNAVSVTGKEMIEADEIASSETPEFHKILNDLEANKEKFTVQQLSILSEKIAKMLEEGKSKAVTNSAANSNK